MMKTLLAVINVMAFCVLSFTAFVKLGYAEEVIKHSAKGVVREIVQEELEKVVPQGFSNKDISDKDSWWR
jgi:hypothetical protein